MYVCISVCVCVCKPIFSFNLCCIFCVRPTRRMRDILAILKFMLPTRIRTFTQLLGLRKVYAFQFSCPKTVQLNLHFHFHLHFLFHFPASPLPLPRLATKSDHAHTDDFPLVPLNITSGYVVENWFILFPLTVCKQSTAATFGNLR